MSLPGNPPYLDSEMVEIIEVCQRHFIAMMKELEPLCETNTHMKITSYSPELTMLNWDTREPEVFFLVQPGEADPFRYAEIQLAAPNTFRKFGKEKP